MPHLAASGRYPPWLTDCQDPARKLRLASKSEGPMTIFSHLLSIISYGVLATIFALVLPTMVPDVGVTTG